jgi:quinoprotein glucose dehydrogenase
VRRNKVYRITGLFFATAVLVAGFLSLPAIVSGQSNSSEVPWTSYGGDLASTRYRPFDQINAANFSKLEVAWRFKVDNLGPRPEYKLEGTPLMVHGVLYATGGTRRSIVALDAATGELMWVHSEREGIRGANGPRLLSGRGLAYWTDGKEERILYVTPGYQLVALDARSGDRVPSFGNNGIVDLKLNDDQNIDLNTAQIGLQATPMIAKDVVIIGAAFLNESIPKSQRMIKGYVRGFDVHTGKRLWIFHTVPMKGEFGYDTWEKGSAEYTGNTGMWTNCSIDPDLGLAYLPIELATGDVYGGPRPGRNLFSETLVAVDLKTGVRKWHFQLVHHGLWDMDIPAPPMLVDINVGGRAIKALAQTSKQGFVYVLDRANGEPVWPIVETPVEAGNVPGEWYSPTQPIPSKPPAFGRNFSSVDELMNFTPDLQEEAMKFAQKFHMGPVFTPPVLSKADGPIASIVAGPGGGTGNWGGGAYDPDTHMIYIHACNSCMSASAAIPTPSPEISDIPYISGNATQKNIKPPVGLPTTPGAEIPTMGMSGLPVGDAGEGGIALRVKGLPLFKPPYGLLTAINLDKGEIAWQVAHGDTPDAVRNNPALKGLQIPRTGQPANPTLGTLVTKSLVILGDPEVTTTSTHPRGALLHAYDKATGAEVGSVYMPAPQTGSPMTYMLNGKQYIVIAIGGGNYSGEYVAFALPRNTD